MFAGSFVLAAPFGRGGMLRDRPPRTPVLVMRPTASPTNTSAFCHSAGRRRSAPAGHELRPGRKRDVTASSSSSRRSASSPPAACASWSGRAAGSPLHSIAVRNGVSAVLSPLVSTSWFHSIGAVGEVEPGGQQLLVEQLVHLAGRRWCRARRTPARTSRPRSARRTPCSCTPRSSGSSRAVSASKSGAGPVPKAW